MIDPIPAPLLTMADVRKTLGGNAALHLPALDIATGARILVTGDNGAGKSTLLRVIAGLIEIDSGELHSSAAWKKLALAYLPQTGGAWRDLTLEENVDLFQILGGRGMSYGDRSALAKQLGLDGAMDRKVGVLSGGMQRLAAFFCRLCTSANVLILDEPSSGLDDTRRVLIYDALLEAQSRFAAVIATEHQFSAAARHHDSYYTQKVEVRRAGEREAAA